MSEESKNDEPEADNSREHEAPEEVIEWVELMIRDITNPVVEGHERGWARRTARETIWALRRLPVEQRMAAMGMRPGEFLDYEEMGSFWVEGQ